MSLLRIAAFPCRRIPAVISCQRAGSPDVLWCSNRLECALCDAEANMPVHRRLLCAKATRVVQPLRKVAVAAGTAGEQVRP